MRVFWAVILRDLRLTMRHGGDTLAAMLFFVVATSLFPLGISPSPDVLARIAPGVIWVCALLASLLPLDRLYGADFEDGSLDQLLLSGLSPGGLALAKTLVHWISTGLPWRGVTTWPSTTASIQVSCTPGSPACRSPSESR